MIRAIRNIYLAGRLFQAAAAVVVVFVVSFFFTALLLVAKSLLLVLIALLLADLILLFSRKKALHAERIAPTRLSNGDVNEIEIRVRSAYPYAIHILLIDEIPLQLQLRNLSLPATLMAGAATSLRYNVRPVKRGRYQFGCIHAYARSPLGLINRRFRFPQEQALPVYPSYVQMKKYELMALSNRIVDSGIKRVRRLGHNKEFELVREYAAGDDVRTVNWKATARHGHPMVNQYQEERSQPVYCIIDKGRAMQMPFEGMSLLDYAINTSLAVSNVVIKTYDRPGLITYQDEMGSYLPASGRRSQLRLIIETLFNQKTGYREPDFSRLFGFIREKLSQRSLLLLFTNFESIYGLERELPFLRRIAKLHLLVVIFFENTEINRLATTETKTLREIYYKAVAEKFIHEKRMVVKALRRWGIQTILTPPEHLTVSAINKYLEIKARAMI